MALRESRNFADDQHCRCFDPVCFGQHCQLHEATTDNPLFGSRAFFNNSHGRVWRPTTGDQIIHKLRETTDWDASRCVNGIPEYAAQPAAAVMPGTTLYGKPASVSAATSSPPRPKMNRPRDTTVKNAFPETTTSKSIANALAHQRAQVARDLCQFA